MKLTSVVAGQEIQTEEFFRGANDAPLTFSAPVKYTIRDFNDAKVLEGFASQDSYNLARWTAQFTIPSTAPIGKPGQKYKIEWEAKTASGAVYNRSDYFDLETATEFSDGERDIDERIVMEGDYFSDSIIVPANEIIDAISVSVADMYGNVAYDSGALSIEPASSDLCSQRFYHKSPAKLSTLIAPIYNCVPFMVTWTYNVNGIDNRIIHFLYAVNSRTINMLANIRTRIDKARNVAYNPALTWYDTDLIKYLDLGLQMFNANPPTHTSFSMVNLPEPLTYPVLQCAVFNALSAQAMAEGQAAFNMSGQSVTLDVDRTASIEAEISRVQSYIDQNLKQTKRLHIRRTGGGGVLGVNVASKSFNWAPPLFGRMGYFLDRMLYR